MGYKSDVITMEQAKEQYKNYPYALLYMMSEMTFAKTNELDRIPWEECLEARFFGKEGELHVFRTDGEMNCRSVKDEVTDAEGEAVLEQYKLDRRFQKLGNGIIVKRYLEYDEDGQAYIRLTRLADII